MRTMRTAGWPVASAVASATGAVSMPCACARAAASRYRSIGLSSATAERFARTARAPREPPRRWVPRGTEAATEADQEVCMLRALLKAVLVIVILVGAAAFLFGWWTGGGRTHPLERPAIGTSGHVDTSHAREVGA